ncbi:hypothetical protein [Hymenobacter armeniacus]|uniref:Uncharacterized protein n=1 Tax=Hymenobacter armeniacus TaxID=2771358 RepID=A0ABR8JZ39_9BACT|nr:hypothetical protein [Hymenobacter armeniacus]MBD2724707.1 hypothetical protein [Hymenobacter armeniacus]
MKTLSLICSTTLLLLSCSKKEVEPTPPPPAPAQEATVNVAVTYYDATPARGASYLAENPIAKQYSDRIEFAFNSPFASDQLRFIMPKSKMKAGWVGTYAVGTQPNPGLGDVLVEYLRPLSGSASNFYSSNGQVIDNATFTVTAYDAGRQLLAGNFTLLVRRAKNPYSFLSTPVPPSQDPRSDADIKLYGVFNEVPLR